MINFQLQLLPSEWKCDIWVSKEKHEVAFELSKKYGENLGYWQEMIRTAGVVHSTFWSIPDREYHILVYLEDFTEKIVVHECLHITQHFAKIIGHNWTIEGQELHAIYLEWLFDEIMKRKV